MYEWIFGPFPEERGVPSLRSRERRPLGGDRLFETTANVIPQGHGVGGDQFDGFEVHGFGQHAVDEVVVGGRIGELFAEQGMSHGIAASKSAGGCFYAGTRTRTERISLPGRPQYPAQLVRPQGVHCDEAYVPGGGPPDGPGGLLPGPGPPDPKLMGSSFPRCTKRLNGAQEGCKVADRLPTSMTGWLFSGHAHGPTLAPHEGGGVSRLRRD